MKKLFYLFFVLSVIAACTSPQNKAKKESTKGLLDEVKVVEVIQSTNYTYMRVNDTNTDKWVAVNRMEAATGETLFLNLTNATPMENFHSKELNKDFKSIFFVSQVSKEQITPKSQPAGMAGMSANGSAVMGGKSAPVQANVSVKPVTGGITIADLYANKAKYAGKKVKVTGSVVKVNDEIMGKNWVHIQDGTKDGENFDLTITTKETVKTDTIVVFEGVVAVDKDFTHGYVYPLIVEDAVLVK